MESAAGRADPVLRRRGVVAVAGLAAGLLAGAAVASTPPDGSVPLAVAVPVVVLAGWTFLAAALLIPRDGLVPVVRVLLAATGFAWLAGTVGFLDVLPARAAGALVGNIWLALLAHLLLTFPDGRVSGAARRGAVVVAYLLSGPTTALVVVSGTDVVAWGAALAQMSFGVVLAGVLAHRVRTMPPGRRRVLAPVMAGGVAVVVALIAVQTLQIVVAGAADLSPGGVTDVDVAVAAVLGLFPAGLAVAAGRTHLDRARIADVLGELDRALPGSALR
ncbi:MAG TPA: hypothetical protein VD813_10620, partial [Pseudonocardia sp.]|nr:hypothetical protein [Pseudonocardia sp.]